MTGEGAGDILNRGTHSIPGAAEPPMKREIVVMENLAFIDIFLRYRGVNN